MIKNIEKGFTLIELLVVVALMAISVGITSDILVTLIRSYNKSQIMNEIEQNSTFISQKMELEIRNASRVISFDPTDAELNVGDSFRQITVEDKSGNVIAYRVLNGVMSRDYVPSGTGFQPLTVNSGPSGVNVSCSDTVNNNNCFTLLSTDPQVVRISMFLTQTGSPSSKIFEGKVKIEDTLVIRDTY